MIDFPIAMLYLVVIGLLLGIIFDEKQHRFFWFICSLVIGILIVEITKEVSMLSYDINFVTITFIYLLIFVLSIAGGVYSNRWIKHKAFKWLEEKDNDNYL